jgi:hypothetical protein
MCEYQEMRQELRLQNVSLYLKNHFMSLKHFKGNMIESCENMTLAVWRMGCKEKAKVELRILVRKVLSRSHKR